MFGLTGKMCFWELAPLVDIMLLVIGFSLVPLAVGQLVKGIKSND